MKDLLGASLRALFIPETIGVLIGVIFLLFLVSTIVPGYLYDKIPVGVAFRNYRENRRKWKLALLWVQFAINIFLVCFMFVIAAQYDKALNDRPGYTYENVLYYNVRGVDQLQASRSIAAISSNPEVVDVERCYGLPFDYCSGNNIYLPGMIGNCLILPTNMPERKDFSISLRFRCWKDVYRRLFRKSL